jgi:hypothetical protein
MNDLIEALQLMATRATPESPTWCTHDELHVAGVDPELFTPAEIVRLDELGFFVSGDGDFMSFRFGSA